MSLKDRKGLTSGVLLEIVSEEVVRCFSDVVGAPVSEPPLTLPTCFRKTEEQLFNQLGLDLSHVLHGEQEYLFERPWKAGMRILCSTTLSNVLEKKAGGMLMQFLLFETRFEDEETKNLVATSKSTIIVRTPLEDQL